MEESKSIIIILPGALGDVINTIPAIKALRGNFPSARIEAVGAREWMELILAEKIVDQIHDLEMPGFHSLFTEQGPPGKDIKNFLDIFDLVISWMRDRQGAMKRNMEKLGKPAVFFKEKFPPDPGSLPASIILSQPVRELGIHKIPNWPELNLPDTNSNENEDYIAVHPGSGSPSKCWPADRLAQAAETLARNFSLKMVIIEGPADSETSSALLEKLDTKPEIIRNRKILDVAGVLSGAKLFIGNDSGISHLAAALRVPSVVIFGPTDPGVWGPRQPWAKIINPDIECAPCAEDERRACDQRDCLEAVPAQDAIEAASGLIAGSLR